MAMPPGVHHRSRVRRSCKIAIVGVLALVVGTAAGAPAASAPSRQTASFEFTTPAPGSPSGTVLEVDYVNPADPKAKPPAVRRVVTTLAPGARYDTSVPALCTASDAELMARGAAACPAASKIGFGSLRFDTGVPGPGRLVDADIDLLNNTDELILLNTVRGSSSRVVSRAPIEGRRIVSDVPMLPGTPPDGGALDTTRFEDFTIGAAQRGYVVTPPECPPSGHWTNSVSFTYADGATETVESRSPCESRRGGGGDEGADGRPCLPQRLRVNSLRIGPARLGGDMRTLAGRYRAVRRGPRATRFCVRGGDRFLVAARRGRIELVSSTARGHATRRTAPGRSLAGVRLAGVRKVGPALLVGTIRGRGAGRVAYRMSGRRVASLAVVPRRQALRPLALARRLRALGLHRR